MLYYIVKDEGKEGPMDILAVITKINKGDVTRETLISTAEDDTPVPAGEVTELQGSFEVATQEENRQITGLDVSQAIKNSKYFVLENITTVPVMSGILLLSIILAIMAGTAILQEIGAIVGCAIAYLFLGVFSVYIVQKTQGLVETEDVFEVAKAGALHLLLFGAVFAIPPVLMVSALATITGNFMILAASVAVVVFVELVVSTFVPFIILSEEKSFIKAFQLSLEALSTLKKADFTKIMVINLLLVLGAFVVLLPLLFVLPFAIATFAEIYQNLFED